MLLLFKMACCQPLTAWFLFSQVPPVGWFCCCNIFEIPAFSRSRNQPTACLSVSIHVDSIVLIIWHSSRHEVSNSPFILLFNKKLQSRIRVSLYAWMMRMVISSLLLSTFRRFFMKPMNETHISVARFFFTVLAFMQEKCYRYIVAVILSQTRIPDFLVYMNF